ncbi:unnamed protein product, partial [Effrenium voratum]
EDLKELPQSPELREEFRSNQLVLLQNFQTRQERAKEWQRHVFEPKLVPVFHQLEKNQRAGFFPTMAKANTLNGIQVHRVTVGNLTGLASKLKGEAVQLQLGVAYSLAGCHENWPNKKKDKQAVKNWKQQGFDCMEAQDPIAPKPFLVWAPFAIYGTQLLNASRERLLKAAAILEARSGPSSLLPRQIRLDPPSGPLVLASEQPEDGPDGDARYGQIEELQGTLAETFVFPREWDGALAGGLSDRHEAELRQKLSCLNSSATPFAGKNLLQQLKASCEVALLDLLLALELPDEEESEAALETYLKAVRATPRQEAHPLLLLALCRRPAPNAPNAPNAPPASVLQAFPALQPLLSEAEKARLAPETAAVAGTEAAAVWEEMKETKGCSSEAMDELMALTGLKRVKDTAVALYKSALQFQRMSPEARKANAMALNYCFLGNPGTGKTTVARLFAAVLHDSGLRSKNVFKECGAQKLKDDGIDEFRTSAQDALDGVLFIDEAYDLDPLGDKFKGAPIVNELVTLTENERARLTCILAGYEDDMNNKLFAYNSGLKSRFTEVIFEDFDESELSKIWEQNMVKRGWSAEDPRLTAVAVRRISKSRGQKGFGNARE